MIENPLVSMVLLAYNQEEYIREAVEGGFAQTYRPLEIILSDDCSTDGTFQIMAEMAERYSGPHEVRLNRNERNLGIVGHVNRVLSGARGQLFVMAAGDDVSLPERTATLVRAWLERDRRPDGLCSGFIAVEGDRKRAIPPPTSVSVLEQCRRGTSPVLGATATWSRRLWEDWGPLPAEALAEDQILTFRALLSGGMCSVAAPLVISRRSGPQRNDYSVWENRWWRSARRAAFCAAYAKDLTVYGRRNPATTKAKERLLMELACSQRRHTLAAGLLAGGPLFRVSYIVLFLLSASISGKRSLRSRLRPVLGMAHALFEPRFAATEEKLRFHRYLRE